MESGTSNKQPKNPFIRPAINKARGKAIDEMQKAFEKEIKNLFYIRRNYKWQR